MNELFKTRSLREILGPANCITLLRIGLTFLLLYFILIRSLKGIIPVFIFTVITDFLDGWVARNMNSISNLGKVLDPVADKIFVLSVFTSRIVIINFWMWWIFIPLLLEELFLISLGGLGFLRQEEAGESLGSNYFGKLKFSSHCLIAFFLLVFPTSWYNGLNWLSATILSLVIISALLGAFSIGKHIIDYKETAGVFE